MELRVPTADCDRLDRFFAHLRAAADAVLLLDYDGTLAPFRVERGEARPYVGVAERLADVPRTRLVLVSGRPALDVRALLGVEPAPEIWGVHGLERAYPDGRLEREALSTAALEALDLAERWGRAHLAPGRVERKAGAVALHFRGLSARETARVTAEAEAALADLGRPLLRWTRFDAGMELRSTRVDKGTAVARVLADMPRAAAAYLGDDETDEDAFAAIGETGLSALVRPEPRPSRAQVWLRPPEALLAFLDRWRDARATVPR